ncbi:MAG: hypothetical protein NZ959_11285 [Armatimonadetes bacterium]|nr:hypothetical protein [Armatimonadota bacterium]MDW8122926.1 hypothetical protein [Armatimonadota bacterium]
MKDKGRFLARAKVLMAQNIQRRTIFTRSDLNSLISLSPDIQESLDYLVTVKALTEHRHIGWFEKPDRGVFFPKAPADLKSAWDLPSTPPAGFIQTVQIYPIANSQQVTVCTHCAGAGAVSRICYVCNGGGRRLCRFCNGSGWSAGKACSTCGGGGSHACYDCNGSGRTVSLCSNCLGCGRIIRYQAVVCAFRPYEFNQVISRWTLPVKEMKAAEATDTVSSAVNPANAPVFDQLPSEVQTAVNFLAAQAKDLETQDTRLARCELTIKSVNVVCVNFRLQGLPGTAWVLGEHNLTVYIPNVPLTLETWIRLKDWGSVALLALSGVGFSAFLAILHQNSFSSTLMITLWILSCTLWGACGLLLLVRRLFAGLLLFAVTLATLCIFLIRFKGSG